MNEWSVCRVFVLYKSGRDGVLIHCKTSSDREHLYWQALCSILPNKPGWNVGPTVKVDYCIKNSLNLKKEEEILFYAKKTTETRVT